jgi:NADP-dependent aldehyde dehydrogenase
MELTGQSFIASKRGAGSPAFYGINPLTGAQLEPGYAEASAEEIARAVQLAAEAAAPFAAISGRERAAFLRRIAANIDAVAEPLVERAHAESGLSLPRLTGETARTTGQLRLFATLLEEGSWLRARIDTALPDRKPMARPALRSVLRPLGPVVVFGASNFPLAFSVAGGDTASALASGCPVVVKAHPAHPGTSELAAEIITDAVAAEGLHPGVFTMLFDSGISVGTALVKHPLIRAVAFTGSLRAGRALMDLAAARRDPIPCFTEMSSGNPVFVLPGALRKGPAALAQSLFGSFTLGSGQFCTKPGIVLVPESPDGPAFFNELKSLVEKSQPFTLLTAGIAREYVRASESRAQSVPLAAVSSTHASETSFSAQSKLFTVCLDQLLGQPQLAEEIFGPDTLLVHCDNTDDYIRAARALDGHLTATLLGDEDDLLAHRELIHILEQKAGRLIFNAFPTGVEVTHAMVHGGPYPSTSDPRFTSVGSLAIYRFARPVCFQGFPQSLLPRELQDANPLAISRLRDGKPESAQ